MRILMLDRGRGANDATSEVIRAKLPYVTQLLLRLGDDFGLTSTLPKGYVEPKTPQEERKEFWLEVADDQQNLLWRITPRQSFPNDNRTRPTPAQVCRILNLYCTDHRITGLNFEVPELEPV